MKTYNTILVVILTALIAASCSSIGGSGSYFGYSNKPRANESRPSGDTQIQTSSQTWTNPMVKQTDDSRYQYLALRSEDLRRNDYNYNRTVFVPVIVPWWSGYYGWVSVRHHGRWYYHPSSGFWGCGWYSPWYDYHPYYGRYWDPWAPWYHRSWYHQPVYAYSTNKPNHRDTYRSFGANRGTYTYDERNASSQSPTRPSGQSGTVISDSPDRNITPDRVSSTSTRTSEGGYNRTDVTSSPVRTSDSQPRTSTENIFRIVENDSRSSTSEPTRNTNRGTRTVTETESPTTRSSARPVESAPIMRDTHTNDSRSSSPNQSSGSVRSGSSSSGSSSGNSSSGGSGSSGSSRSGSSSGSGSGQRTR